LPFNYDETLDPVLMGCYCLKEVEFLVDKGREKPTLVGGGSSKAVT
jgi:hypothetical protein